jgi:hypothetical protein
MDMLKHLELIVKTRHPKWNVRKKENDLWLEGVDYTVATPARKYSVGWACLIGLAGDGELRIKEDRIWVQPAYGKTSGVGWHSIETLPKKVKRASIDNAMGNALRSLKKEAEFEIILPNSFIARWDAFKNKITSWGEIPKKINEKNLQRPKISWEDFLEEQSSRGGFEAKNDWEKHYKKWDKTVAEKSMQGLIGQIKNA